MSEDSYSWHMPDLVLFSSFTKQILDSREIQVRDGSSSLKNIVQLFGGLAASR